nr:hypothetical protein BaRGS_004281 [Batillaria attramentaria]
MCSIETYVVFSHSTMLLREAPEPAALTSVGGELKKTQTDEDFSEVPEDDVYNNDFNRVILHKPEGDNSSDYINATYIKVGPRVNTIDDLWWMVWQEGITQILMLANLKEEGKSERHVTQYHYMAWPDHGAPLAASLVDYWRYVKARTTSTVPLLVHCSAGVGRTGTFIALDIASEKESRGDDVNVNEIVTQLREQRALMVQSEAQYKFLHEVILEAHTSRATRVTVAQFDSIFPDSIDENKENARIDREFQMLKLLGQFSAKPTSSMATMPENLDKNRNTDVLPDDDHLAYLSAYVRGRTQYINAVYLPSFHHRHGFMLTQLPIPNNTLIDFWRLVDGCHVTKIVSLGDGAAKSGLFAVLCDVISRVTHDDEVDVYLTAREVQRIRPQAVATQTQYRYQYKAAQEYIRHVGVHANSGVR